MKKDIPYLADIKTKVGNSINICSMNTLKTENVKKFGSYIYNNNNNNTLCEFFTPANTVGVPWEFV